MRRLDNIDLRLLRVFVTLVEAGSFADAQIALNLSQSTLSTHLATLEKKLGGTLCIRGRRGFKLTSFGEATWTAAQKLFTDIDSFQERVGEHNGQLVGRLRVGVVDGIVTNPVLGLQHAIRRYVDKAESVYIDLELGTPHLLEQAVADGRRDVVIGPFSQKAPGVTYVALHREPQRLYCGRGHELFGLPARNITSAMIEQSLFSVRAYRQLDDLYRVDHPRASGQVVQMEAQVMMILSGRFIGFLPGHIGDVWLAQGQMREIKPETYQFLSTHFAAYRRSDASRPVIRSFVRELSQYAGEMRKTADAG
ncbi:MAG: LysR family transcriptional regulator [Parvibaculaceae bacterium]|nr:LysR family transcriptional regulator [Parvibaculaceae bacterium]